MSTCIITGAGSGIGRATAVELSKRVDYSTLVLTGRSEEKLRETEELMWHEGKEILRMPFDLANLEEIPALVKEIYQRCGSIDCLLNIAGYTDPQALLTTSLESMRQTYEVNVFAPFLLIRECAKYMRQNEKGSKVLNVASTALRRKLAPGEDPSTIMQPDEVGAILANLVARDEHCLDGQNIIIRKK